MENRGYSCKIHLMLGLNFECYEKYRIVKKEMYIYNTEEAVMLRADTDEVINEICSLVLINIAILCLEWSFQSDEILEKQKFCQNHGHCAVNIS